MIEKEGRRHFVYRCFDSWDRLVYVGATSNLENRMADHDKPWRDIARWTAEEYPTRAAAFAAERAAIAAEHPAWNSQSRSTTKEQEQHMSLEPDYTLPEVAEALRMSPRWVRDQIKAGAIECTRRGHKITFTAEQVEKARLAHAPAPMPAESITTGHKKRAS